MLPTPVALRSRDGSRVRIVDVTLRDGGYLNQWAFTLNDICAVARAVDDAGVDFIEVGYLSDDPDRPLAARCGHELLHAVRKHLRYAKLAAMLRPRETRIEPLLRSRAEGLDLVRIPTAVRALGQSLRIAEAAMTFGISVSINLTSVSAYRPATLVRAVEVIRRHGVQSVYLADSRGALSGEDLRAVVPAVRSAWHGDLGFHGHNNLARAVENSVLAASLGCTMADGSIYGWGLGGGNASLRELLTLRGVKAQRLRALEAVAARLHLGPRTGECPPAYLHAGRANLEQEWVPLLREVYADQTDEVLSRISPRRYQGLGDFRRRTGLLHA